jgi:hypothetical protein
MNERELRMGVGGKEVGEGWGVRETGLDGGCGGGGGVKWDQKGQEREVGDGMVQVV